MQNSHQDEISVALGADPAVACELLESYKGNDPNTTAVHHAPPTRSNSTHSLELGPPGSTPPNPKNPEEQLPKKKARQAKPQACLRVCNHIEPTACVSHLVAYPTCTPVTNLWQGSEMEVVLLEGSDVPAFISAWVSACTGAEGKATTTCAELRRCKSFVLS